MIFDTPVFKLKVRSTLQALSVLSSFNKLVNSLNMINITNLLWRWSFQFCEVPNSSAYLLGTINIWFYWFLLLFFFCFLTVDMSTWNNLYLKFDMCILPFFLKFYFNIYWSINIGFCIFDIFDLFFYTYIVYPIMTEVLCFIVTYSYINLEFLECCVYRYVYIGPSWNRFLP